MKKRIPMFLLALAMMVAMALPTFAASYRPNAQFGYLLNINGSTGSAYQGACIEPDENRTMGRDQNFIHRNSQGLHRLLHDGYRKCQLCRKSF